jgi:muconate cycloisomerase
MRGFSHAAATRNQAEAVLVCQHFSDGRCGWGETLPRPYVTGETLDSVVEDLEATAWPRWKQWWNARGGSVRLEDLPGAPIGRSPDGRCLNATRACLEQASLSAISLAPLARRIRPRVSGVLGDPDPDRTARKLRQMRLIGLRDFKLKVGLGPEVDRANLEVVCEQLGGAVKADRCTLRVDVNGGWGRDETPHRVEEMARLGVCAVEQPVYVPAGELVELGQACKLPLIADESLLTEEDAEQLAQAGERIWWNVRICKNGGPASAFALCRRALQAGTRLILGCMVGESSLLSICQRAVLQWGAKATFVEGNYGRFLLKGDLTRRPVMMGLGGRLRGISLRRLRGARPTGAALQRRAKLVKSLS